jgi:ABC-type transporter Mla subunit MlaD
LQQPGKLDYLKRNSPSASETISSLSSGSGTNLASASGFGQVLNQLQNLATSDPAQFKQQTSSIASQLNTMASQSSGFEAQLFQNLSTQFQQASQTGQVPKLAASPAPRAHRRPR